MAELCFFCGHPLPNSIPMDYCTNCGEPPKGSKPRPLTRINKESKDTMDDELDRLPYMHQEYAAWMDVMHEMRDSDVGDVNSGGKDERLADAIMAWGECLVALRMHDPIPEHATSAYKEKTEKYLAWNEETA